MLPQLTNRSEKRAFDALSRGLQSDRFHVSKKVGVKDVIQATRDEVSSWSKFRQRIWWTGHFDFVCTLSHTDEIQFVVEYDGSGHDIDPDVELRDRAKNSLCRDKGIPILRIRQENMVEFGKISVLQYIAERYCARLDGELVTAFQPSLETMRRLLDRLECMSSYDSKLHFTTHPGIIQPGERIEFHGIVYSSDRPVHRWTESAGKITGEGIHAVFATQASLTFSWELPVDDEAYENIDDVRVPVYRPCWSELPGVPMHDVMWDVCEYFILVKLESWAQAVQTA